MHSLPSSDWIDGAARTLEQSDSRDELAATAQELALADDPAALVVLGDFLADGDFLARLDDLDDPGSALRNLASVMQPLIDRPGPEVVTICLRLFASQPFTTGPDRRSFLLEAMARVRPMLVPTVEAFREANALGYFSFDAPLLAENGSARALALLFDMLTDPDIDLEERAQCVLTTILHRRTRLEIVQLAGRLMTDSSEDPIVERAIESVFDYQPQWFSLHAPLPPSWRTASIDTLREVIEAAAIAKRRAALTDEADTAIDATLDAVRSLLAARSE